MCRPIDEMGMFRTTVYHDINGTLYSVFACRLDTLFDFLVTQNTTSKVSKTARGASTCVILFLLDEV